MSKNEIERVLKKYKCYYIETSAKQNKNVKEAFCFSINLFLSRKYPQITQIPSMDVFQKWDPINFIYFPSSFRSSLYSFLICLKFFEKNQLQSKFPKFVLQLVFQKCFPFTAKQIFGEKLVSKN